METAAEGAGWLSRFARSCGSWVGVEAGHVRVVRGATLPAARIAAVERGSRGFGRYAFLSAHTAQTTKYVPLGKCIFRRYAA